VLPQHLDWHREKRHWVWGVYLGACGEAHLGPCCVGVPTVGGRGVSDLFWSSGGGIRGGISIRPIIKLGFLVNAPIRMSDRVRRRLPDISFGRIIFLTKPSSFSFPPLLNQQVQVYLQYVNYFSTTTYLRFALLPH